ncbi:uncharacterized protein N7458_000593 [Penicillium daleae]|uniref:Uncharacterized protein n=1 Tax=Penicillium daleae TaxID=63821 RepID=A0AAD6G907_9EURO|nr:uncharacterized protein N7458_000593 [Penicillium daleae]KAJ5464907.1 hypothetical protein N7458_000593 [Penicillium daleae]
MYEVSSPQNRMLNVPALQAYGAQACYEGLSLWGHAGLEHRLTATVRAFSITTTTTQQAHVSQWLHHPWPPQSTLQIKLVI